MCHGTQDATLTTLTASTFEHHHWPGTFHSPSHFTFPTKCFLFSLLYYRGGGKGTKGLKPLAQRYKASEEQSLEPTAGHRAPHQTRNQDTGIFGARPTASDRHRLSTPWVRPRFMPTWPYVLEMTTVLQTKKLIMETDSQGVKRACPKPALPSR